jgi:hypothetical protein
MPAIDWNQVAGQNPQGGAGAPQGAIDWGTVSQIAQVTRPQAAKSGQQQVLDNMSTGEKILAGIGGGMMGMYMGAKQRLGLANQQEVDDYRANMDPLAATKAGLAGQVIGSGAVAAPAMLIPGANTALGAALVGGGTGALQPTKADESVLQNAGLGAAGGVAGKYLGDAVKAGGGAVKQRVSEALAERLRAGPIPAGGGSTAAAETVSQFNPSARVSGGGFGPGEVPAGSAAGLTESQAAAAAAGKKLGMRLTPGQQTGSVPLQQVEAFMESHPATSAPFNAIKQTNQEIINKQAAKAIGESGKVVDSTVLGRAADRIGSVYDEVRATGQRSIDPDQFLNSMAGIEKEYEGLIGDGAKSVVDHPLVKRLMNYAANGDASAEQLSDLASKLTKASNQQMTSPMGDRQLGMALGDVKNQVDELIQAGLPQELASKFADARSQYRNLMLLTSRQGVVNPSNGNVNGRALAAALQAKDRTGFLFGRNDNPLYQAARFSQAFPSIVGDSGTATRMGTFNPVNIALAVPGYVASRAYVSTPSIALARALSAGTSAAENAAMRGAGVAADIAQPGGKYLSPLAAALLEGAVPEKNPAKK